MTTRRLLIRPPAAALTVEDLAWRDPGPQSSFNTRLGPDLRRIGEVPLPHRDLFAVATAVFLADRTVKRPRGWKRQLEIEVPVYDVQPWRSVSSRLAAVLELLTADAWQITFIERMLPAEVSAAASRADADRVLLFSGGADSLCGAIRALTAGERLLLVSHWDWSGHSAIQRKVAGALANRFPDQVSLRQVHLAKSRQQPTGARFPDEPSRRSRSLLFLACGLAYAAIEPQTPMWIAENGYAALNPPLAGERRGALSTRTTHPLVLDEVRQIVEAVGGTANFENPFEQLTKGQMFAEAGAALGSDDASKLLSMSHSCSHVRYAAGTGYPPETQCGVCFGCLVRRAAFAASGIPDQSVYLNQAIPVDRQPPHLRVTAENEVRTVRYAARRGLSEVDLVSMGLPATVSIETALDVAVRGLSELGHVVDAQPDLKRIR